MGEFAYCVRRVEAQLKRVSNLYFTYFNRLKLDCNYSAPLWA